MSVGLEKITRENWDECSRLEVRPEQRAFVNSNLLCIAEAQFHPGWCADAIYFEAQMVGFVMYEDDEDQDEWWISALMISADHQGKGYGKTAVLVLFPILLKKGCMVSPLLGGDKYSPVDGCNWGVSVVISIHKSLLCNR